MSTNMRSKPLATTITLKQTFGPAMSVLNDRQRAFVMAWNSQGARNATEAARAAGYTDGENLKRVAYRLRYEPKIQAAIREDLLARTAMSLADRFKTVTDIAETPGHKDQLNANRLLIMHGGIHEKQITEHQVNVTVTVEQQVERLKELALALGEDPAKFLPANVTDAEFEDVTDEQQLPEIDTGGAW